MRALVLELSDERFAALVEALPAPFQGALDVAAAKVLNSRPQSMRKRPLAMKLKALRVYLTRNKDDELPGEMLRAYFLGPRLDLVKTFLDTTGVAHEDGQVEDDAEPDAARVPAGVEAVAAAHDDEDVTLYLRIAAMQWPENAGIAEAIQGRQAAAS